MNTALNNKERKLVDLLQKVNNNCAWAIAIKEVIAEGLNWKIRRMLADLKSQRADDQYVMRMIIGSEANDLLGTI